MSTQFYRHECFVEHETIPGHPERPARIEQIYRVIDAQRLSGLCMVETQPSSLAQIELIHPRSHIDHVFGAIPAQGLRQIGGDTIISAGSAEPILHAVGGACAAIDAVIGGRARNAFIAARPPGHHAEPEEAMGFCFFNQVAIAARYAQREHGIGRVAIYDFDVHHGNGTEAAFKNDASVMYLSTHESPLFPGTGMPVERGKYNNIVNRCLKPASDHVVWRDIVETEILPAIDAFRPELLLISAGFDAHLHDPLANQMLMEEDFAWVTGELLKLADRHSQGRVVSVLEGGYDLNALSQSVLAHVETLAHHHADDRAAGDVVRAGGT